jgi:UDP-glucose 4-epimerase
MNLVITGGLGHIGSFLLRNLHSSLKIEKILIIDSLRTQRFASLFNLPTTPKFIFLEKDVLDLKPEDISEYGEFDCVIHLAAITDAAGSVGIKSELFSNNLGATTNIVRICSKLDIPLIFPSSTSVYGSQDKLVDENSENLLPQSPYAECKLDEEALVIKASQSDLRGVVLRFGTIHGTSIGMRFHTAVNKFCYQAATGIPLTIWKTAQFQFRPYLSLIDASNAIAHVITNNLFGGNIYNVLTENATVDQIIEAINKVTPYKCEIEFVESKIMNQLSYEVSNLKFRETGFSFTGNLQDDVSNTMNLLMGINHGNV